jgi:hypothetical protein
MKYFRCDWLIVAENCLAALLLFRRRSSLKAMDRGSVYTFVLRSWRVKWRFQMDSDETRKANVKLAGFLLVLATVPATAPLFGQATAQSPSQSGVQRGLRLGGSIAFLTEYADVPLPQDPRDPPLSGGIEAIFAAVQDAGRGRLEWLANSTGADVLLVENPNGSKPPLLLSPKPSAAFETWAEQRSTDYVESAKTGFTGIDRMAGKAILRRFVRDDVRQIYVSYTVTVETLADGTYRVSFGPSRDEPSEDLRNNANWKLLSPVLYPAPQIVRDEDSIRLELYSTSGASRRLVDYVHAGRPDRMVIHNAAPRDAFSGDAEISVTRPRLRVNGATNDRVAALPETIRGTLLWIYVPGHGRYLLSLHPPDLAFESAGEVGGNSLTFTSADGNVFCIDTIERIAAGSATYILYVLSDLGWEPADPQDRARVMIGSQMAAY